MRNLQTKPDARPFDQRPAGCLAVPSRALGAGYCIYWPIADLGLCTRADT